MSGRYRSPVALDDTPRSLGLHVPVGPSRPIGFVGMPASRPRPARQFYLHSVREFVQSPSDDLHLVLRMKDIRRALTTGDGPPT